MSYQGYAQICTNGHVNELLLEQINLAKDKYCSQCGEKLITKCPNCDTPIKGLYCSDYAFPDSNQYTTPSYCTSCSKPYPWTEATLESAENIINMLDKLTPSQKKELKDLLPDIIIETPRSQFAALVVGKFMEGIQGLASEALKFWLTKNALPQLIVFLNLHNL